MFVWLYVLLFKRTCLADANNNESFLLKNKNASFFRRTVRDIWDKSDGFLNLYPEDLVALCYHRAIVKSTKTFAKEVTYTHQTKIYVLVFFLETDEEQNPGHKNTTKKQISFFESSQHVFAGCFLKPHWCCISTSV